MFNRFNIRNREPIDRFTYIHGKVFLFLDYRTDRVYPAKVDWSSDFEALPDMITVTLGFWLDGELRFSGARRRCYPEELLDFNSLGMILFT